MGKVQELAQTWIDKTFDETIQRAGFTTFSNIIIRGYPELSNGAFRTYVFLCSFAKAGTDLVTIAQKDLHLFRSRIGRTTMYKHIQELQSVGLVRQVQTDKYDITYQIGLLSEEKIKMFQ